MINAQFAKDDLHFRVCCELAGVQPTRRQASKYRNHKGSAYNKYKEVGRKVVQKLVNKKIAAWKAAAEKAE